MRRVVIESPYGSNIDGTRASPKQVEHNVKYVRACMADCLHRNEAPYASHALYTQPSVLNDDVPEERKLGMAAGFAWQERTDIAAVYTDLGVTSGMGEGIRRALDQHFPIVFRSLGDPWLRLEREAAVSLILHPVLETTPRILCVWNARYMCWSMPGGLQEDNESIYDTQARELTEEVGVATISRRLVFRGPHGISSVGRPGRASVVSLFEVEAFGEPHEAEKGCPTSWMTVEEFLKGSVLKPLYEKILPAIVSAAVGRKLQRAFDEEEKVFDKEREVGRVDATK
jgi:ADP-ribose pyrophosphatase YjhB (NUDIX family)